MARIAKLFCKRSNPSRLLALKNSNLRAAKCLSGEIRTQGM